MQKGSTDMRNVARKMGKGKPSSGAVERGRASARLSAMTGGKGVAESLGSAGKQSQVAILQELERTDDKAMQNSGRRDIPLETEKAALLAAASGASSVVIEERFGLAKGYVDYALKRRYGSKSAAKEALHGLVLENAIACNVHASQNIEEMTGPQAVMAGAILIDKALAIEKSISEERVTIDFSGFASLGATLAAIGEIVLAKPSQPSPLTPSEKKE